MHNEMYDLIKKEKSEINTNTKKVEKNIWLVFTIGKRYYALPSHSVKEILRDTPVYPLPFAPNYIPGVVNRYGDPYAVIDPSILFGEEEQKSLLFIVLNDETHSCLRITDVKDFYTATEQEISHFAQEDLAEYFEGSININNEETLVLKPQVFIEKAGNDIAS